MRRLLLAFLGCVAAPAAILVSVLPAGAAARPRGRAPRPISCPDPSVTEAPSGGYRYYLVCTSDRATNAFPIRGSNDLRHWRLVGSVFPKHHQPWWALHSPTGRYWGPTLYHFGGHWVVYFATEYDPRKVHITLPRPYALEPASMVLGVASATSLHGPWHTKLLHYRGEFNHLGGETETYGGDIDPAMVQDPRTGQRYLVWAEQHTSSWIARLSSDGTSLEPPAHQALWVDHGWDCSPINHACVMEGPVAIYHNGWFYLFYSGAGTWDGTYAVGVAVAQSPMSQRFARLDPFPLLRANHGWVSTGGNSAPVTGPNGQQYLFYHASPGANPGHKSADRYLLMSHLVWTGIDGFYPTVVGAPIVPTDR